MSSETSYTALSEEQCNCLRSARNHVEFVINSKIENIEYLIPLKSWNCIIIMMGNDSFSERKIYSSKKNEMDFRLQIDSNSFISASEIGRYILIYEMLIRSLNILNEKFLKTRPKVSPATYSELERLKKDVIQIAKDNQWVVEPLVYS